LQGTLDLQNAELLTAREALNLEGAELRQTKGLLSAAKEKLSALKEDLIESERKLQASSQSGKIAQLQERIQDLEATNVDLVAQLSAQSEQALATPTL
jgi:uncharacterized protein YjcR